MGKQRDEKKPLESATALLALAAASRDAEDLQKDCPGAEEFAAYSEGKGMESERATFFAHLEGCGSCYRHWLMVNEDIVKQDQTSKSGRLKRYSYIGSALAVAASVVVFLNLREPVPVLIHFDENEVQEVTEAEENVLPSLHETTGKEEKSAVEKFLKPETDTAGVSDAMIGEQQEELSFPEAKKSINKLQRTEEEYPRPQQKSPRKARKVHKSVQEMAPAQVTSIDSDRDKKSPSGFTSWVDELRKGCLAEQWQSSFWRELAGDGEILYKNESNILSAQELSLLKKLLIQINQIDESSFPGQCERLMEILAEGDASR